MKKINAKIVSRFILILLCILSLLPDKYISNQTVLILMIPVLFYIGLSSFINKKK